VPCYSIEEVFAEKMREFFQRSYTAPRDYYDLWYLSKHFAKIDYIKTVEAFYRKAAFKGHTFTGIEQLLNPEKDKQLSAAWKNSLAYQISGGLEEYDVVKTELYELFKRIFK